ncbi:NAD(P)-dependent oxidoreductase [Carbonactinospora thermoautotrophica]|uniref:SDR family oxidoreductase n=1 Tax=Carbonactinospora thermoautotrophica TaxID=1469144 RepID=UPI00226E2CCE|nr:SDR family oxidoreductase [Carbonactinospora thermoautotrophica]MCX9192831.1 NAD(P)-dependent oxidoreductase [Carbonactinospora thermoautotrophica]
MTTVLVTGATGKVGSRVVQELRACGVPVRAFVRDPDRAAAVLGRGVELAVGDFAEPESIRRALAGVERVFLTSGDSLYKVEYETNVIDAAAGVRRLVMLSTVGAEVGSPVGLFDWHGRIERHLRGSGIPAVVLQASHLMSNVLAFRETITQASRFFLPVGKARIAMIDPRDVAAVAAAVLTTDGHDGKTYLLTGPEAITYHDVAERLSAAAGRTITFVDLPDEAAWQRLVQAGMPEWLADDLVALCGLLREGLAEPTTGTVQALTGREPRDFAEFARHHAGLFRLC